jgi:tripartite-type tricarboxylate transporter receptor subunit TctC
VYLPERAGRITSTGQVLNSKPDGHTLLMDVHATSSMLFAVQSDVPFRMEDKTPSAWSRSIPRSSPSIAWQSLKDVAEAAKANPKGSGSSRSRNSSAASPWPSSSASASGPVHTIAPPQGLRTRAPS